MTLRELAKKAQERAESGGIRITDEALRKLAPFYSDASLERVVVEIAAAKIRARSRLTYSDLPASVPATARELLIARGLLLPVDRRPTLRLRPGEREKFESLALCNLWNPETPAGGA